MEPNPTPFFLHFPVSINPLAFTYMYITAHSMQQLTFKQLVILLSDFERLEPPEQEAKDQRRVTTSRKPEAPLRAHAGPRGQLCVLVLASSTHCHDDKIHFSSSNNEPVFHMLSGIMCMLFTQSLNCSRGTEPYSDTRQ